MIVMGDGRAKQSHDAVAHDLLDRPLVAAHGGHRALQHRVENRSRVFGIVLGEH
jgi:hypothetical protein